MTDTLWSQPHHDGSATYVPEPDPRLGGKVTVFLRVPRTNDVTSAWVRVLCDGEPELVRAAVDRQDELDTWLRADGMVTLPSNGPAFGIWQLSI
jgi:alpha-glucosidase